jgi:hypothetical protein
MPAGTNVTSGVLISPGGQQGIPGPNAVSADTGNQATFGSDNKIYVPNPTPIITSVRMRSFNAIGNPNFECNQRSTGQTVTATPAGTWPLDRWYILKNGMSTGAATGVQNAYGSGIQLPGTSFPITWASFLTTLTAQQTTLAATDILWLQHNVESIALRELISDAHSVSILARSSVAGLKFGLAIRDGNAAPSRSLTKLCSLGAANTWTVIQLPNLPVWPGGITWPIGYGALAYMLSVTLASGSTYMSPANDTWQNGNFVGALGQSNFAAQPVNSTFELAFVQHEPGAICTQLIDKPFSQNLDECLRYYSRSYPYGNIAGTATFNGATSFIAANASGANGPAIWPKRMAKTPIAVGVYNPQTGTQNACYNASTGVQIAVTNIAYPSEVGFLQLQGTFVTGTQYLVQWSADTGM